MATILIIDDLSHNRTFLVTLLRHHGHRLLEAADGLQGLTAVHAEKPDLVITDVLMPVMDGYEFVRRLRLDPATCEIPVVFYTAHYGEHEARALALANGVVDVLTKPAESAEVLAIVSRLLSGGVQTRPQLDGAPTTTGFEREHLRLLTDKLSEKAGDLRAANARLRALVNIGLDLASERNAERLLERVCASTRDLFSASYVTLGIVDRHDRTVQRIVTFGTDAAPWIAIGDALSGMFETVVMERRTFRGDNPGGDPAALQLPVRHPVVHAFLVVPIASPANVYGWICLVGNEGLTFTEDDQHMVMALAGQVGRIYENGYFYAMAQKRADELEHEILERKQAEEALRQSERLNRSLVEHLPHRILVKDRHSVTLFCNANYAHDVGLPIVDVIGKDAFAFYPRHLADAYNADDEEVMASGRIKTIEEPHQVGGQERWVHTVKVPYRDELGQVIGVLVVFEDITERRTLEAQFQQAQKMDALGQLAGGVAHDFNNLLTVILGNCELLLADLSPDDLRQADIAGIRAAGASAAALTRQLLAFSRKQPIERTRLDLNAVVTEMRAMLGRLLMQERVTVVLALRPELRPVLADRGQLEQIIMNLAVNARDAMPDGGTLTIATTNVELGPSDPNLRLAVTPGAYVALTVSDTGVGMTAEVQAHLFETFFTTKAVGKGTGLGLATVHGIVARSGGNVRVQSDVGRGTSFTVYFPSADAAGMVVDVPQGLRPRIGAATVLVVDDAEALRQLAKRMLERQGYEVLVAASADEAMHMFKGNPGIDVLLTDVVMPGARGPELTQELIAQRPELKVIYMSGYAEHAIVQHGELSPGIAFLEKPFTSETLGQKVREVLDR